MKPKIIQKVWGHEEILASTEKYCGKKLHLNKGYRCSLHSHAKDETFYIEEGKVYLELENEREEIESRVIKKQEIIHIPENRKHRFSGLKDSIIIEMSTRDVESERFTESEAIPNFETWLKEVDK